MSILLNKNIPPELGARTCFPYSGGDNSMVYDAYFGTGTSLVYTPLLSGAKEEIVLEENLD